jgi:hypothetical protein
MKTPVVSEVTRALEPVTQDPFLDGLDTAKTAGPARSCPRRTADAACLCEDLERCPKIPHL